MNIFIEHVWLLRHDTRHPRQKECTTLPFKILLVSTALLRKRWTPSLHPIFSRLQSFPVSGSFPKSQLFTSGRQIIGASASVLPMNIQGWFPLGFTGLISSPLSNRLWRVFSSAIKPFSATIHWATLSFYVWNWIKHFLLIEMILPRRQG